MPENQTILELEYSVTREEQLEAQSLSLRQQIAFGSKWGALIVLLVVLVGVAAMLGLMIWREVPPGYRGYAVGATGVLCIGFFVRQRRMQRNAKPVATKMRIST